MAGARSKGQEFPVNARQWALAFTEAFALIDPSFLGKVRLRRVAALDNSYLAIVYENWRGAISGRVYTLQQLNEMDEHRHDPAASARGIVVGEFIEPSASGRIHDVELLRSLNKEFPGVTWTGCLP